MTRPEPVALLEYGRPDLAEDAARRIQEGAPRPGDAVILAEIFLALLERLRATPGGRE